MESFIEQVCLCLFTRNLTIPEDLLHRIINWQVLSYRQVKTRRDLSLRLTRNNDSLYFLLYKSFSNFKAFDITLSNSILSSTILNFKYMLGLASAATILNFKYMLGLAVRTHTFLF